MSETFVVTVADREWFSLVLAYGLFAERIETFAEVTAGETEESAA